jgi:hypothetical protein
MTAPLTTHSCPGGCGRQVGRARYACRGCWHRLPFDLRTTITATYQAGRRREHREAMQAAHEWFKSHRPAVSGG